MNSKQQKAYDKQLDSMDLTDSEREAFDHTPKRSLIDLDTYQNTDNPNYWKNKMPHKGYWQQDVHYVIKAKINVANI